MRRFALRRPARRAAAALACALAAGACRDVDPTGPGAAAPARAVPAAAFATVGAGGLYWDTFDFPGARVTDSTGATSWAFVSPAPWRPTDFDVAIHSRDRGTWYAPDEFRAMHGTECQPFQDADSANTVRPGNAGSHAVASYDESNYRCRNHMMTALNAAGYGVIYVTPNAMVDWSGGEASVRFALATLRTSGRDWVDLWVTPWEDNLAVPLDRNLPDMQGPPRRALHIRMTAELGRSAFEAYVVDDFKEYRLTPASTQGYESILTPVSTRRDTFELRLSNDRLQFGMWKGDSTRTGPGSVPYAALKWLDVPYRSLGWTRGVVQFGHHSFNPALAANPDLPAGTGGTWHWDDFQLTRAVPFTIIPTAAPSERFADAARPEVAFDREAPAGASVRFAASGDKFSISTDGGRTWKKVDHRKEAFDLKDRFHSYQAPVPAGTTRVRFRADTPGWFVRDPALWSLVAPAAQPAVAAAEAN